MRFRHISSFSLRKLILHKYIILCKLCETDLTENMFLTVNDQRLHKCDNFNWLYLSNYYQYYIIYDFLSNCPSITNAWHWYSLYHSLGVYWFQCVSPSFCLSPSVPMVLSMHVLTNGCMDFLKICTIIIHHLKMCTWNFHIDWINFLYFTGFFLFLEVMNRNIVLKLLRILIWTLKMCFSWTETLYFLCWFSIFKEFC